MKNAGTIADNLITGTKQGVGNFFDHIGDHLKNFLFDWLFGDVHINWELVPSKWNDWDGWKAFLADLVGLSWDKILDAAQSVFGSEITLVIGLYDKLAESVVAGVKALLDGSGVGRVAELVEEGVAKVFASAASFILSFFGLDAVPKAIRGVVSKLANVIPDKVRELLGKLKDVLLRKLESLWGGFWGRAEWTVGGEKHKAWVDFKRGKVRVASTEEDASAKLQVLKGRADEAKNEKAQGLVAKAEDVLKATQDSLASLQSSARQTEQKGQKGKKKGAEAKAVRDEAKKVESGVSALAMLLREIEEALGGGAGGTCKIGGRSQAKKAGCWREGTRSSRGNGWSCAMEGWRTGRLVRTWAEEERAEEAPPRLVIEPSEWHEVSLVQVDEANGGILTMKLLRPLSWLDSEAVAVGAWVSVDLPELGVQGAALVTAVDPCPEIEEGEGRLVTGTFRRSQALVWEVKVEGASEVLGVTPNHLVWSEDRRDWVAVADLRLGEHLRDWNGSTPVVESLTTCTEPEPVYNIEVEGDHCYRVGEQGLLVHNASAPYTLTQVAKDGPGYEYATAAAKARQKKDSRGRPKKGLLQGKSNGGALKFQEPKAAAKYFPGQGTEASQIRILFYYGVDPMDHPDQKLPRELTVILGDKSTCTKILEFFTERTPCPACVSALPDLLKNFASDEKFPLYYVIQHGKPDSDLIDMYKQWGLWS